LLRKALLICGILSPVLYAISDAAAGTQWKGYSFRDQTISELGAIGAPSRPLFGFLLVIVYALMIAFGVGIRKSAGRDRRLRIVGGLFVALGVLALTAGQFAAMQLRGTEQGLTGALHLVEGAVAMLMIFTAMGMAATVFGPRFRLYTLATIVLALGFGAWTGSAAAQIEQGLATPWVGVIERIFWYGYQSWFIILALTLLRSRQAACAEDGNSGKKQPVSGRPYPFKTPEGEAAYVAAYDAAMRSWPVPFEEMQIPTRFGMTHVIVSGPEEAPPLVLLHGYMATSTMWAPNIGDFSTDYRVYAIDVMGQPSKSIPAEPVRNPEDYAAWLAATLDGLHLDGVFLIGMSYGGWLALNFAIAAPERVQKLVLLSPGGGFVPMAKQFSMRGMLMVWFPRRIIVNWFMRWLGITGPDARSVLELTYLGLKHFRVPLDTLRVMPVLFPEDRLRAMRVPTLLLIGEHEVICDPAVALARARQLFPDIQGELVPESSHNMCFSQHRRVDARVLDFLKETRSADRGAITGRTVA
jgi:pimeloyl-ACP methyl ester carboxylesterase